jgi:AraC-like DNA-binding protein
VIDSKHRTRFASAGVERVRNYLRAHPLDKVTLAQLAEVAGLSRFHLLRRFQRAYGLTPRAYQMELRLALACRLLEAGATPAQASYAAGFADQSHLTRRMKQTLGVTPGLFVRQLGWRRKRSANRFAHRLIVAQLEGQALSA